MGKKILTLANILVILYFITSHYDLPYKWAWLVFSAIFWEYCWFRGSLNLDVERNSAIPRYDEIIT